MKILLVIILVYFISTGTYGAIMGACYDVYNTDKSLVYSILGFLFGWLIVPVKFIKGVYEIIKDSLED